MKHFDRLAVGFALMASATAFAQGVTNPVRGKPEAIAAGQASFEAHCARCHGEQATEPSAEAPDLRRLDAFCRRLKDAALKAHCLSDVDSYYLMSVHAGKVRAGIRYMPAWQGVLTDDEIWAIRSFIESRPIDPPRVTTSVDAAKAAAAKR